MGVREIYLLPRYNTDGIMYAVHFTQAFPGYLDKYLNVVGGGWKEFFSTKALD